jgi:catechol 2,3-dioxygenase-like lactoylglutathione lyase family enzyme
MTSGRETAGIPGLRGVEHVGLTVPNLEQAVAFFRDVIGCDFIFDGGAFGPDPAFMPSNLGVHPQASLRYCFMRCRTGVNFEIFEYASPDQNQQRPKNSDWGGHHLAFYVDDFQAALTHLKAHGVPIMGEPQFITDGPAAGSWWVYFLSPWGLQLELCCYPEGKAYEKTAIRKMWHPARPEQ